MEQENIGNIDARLEQGGIGKNQSKVELAELAEQVEKHWKHWSKVGVEIWHMIRSIEA